MKEMKLTLVLVIICVISGLGLSFVFQYTYPTIEQHAKEELENSLQEVFPADNYEELRFKSKIIEKLYSAKKNDEVIGKIALVKAAGYQGHIKMLVGIDNKKKITAVNILEHTETPGLGSRIAEESFLQQFVEKNKEEIDTITGATISSKAVIENIFRALEEIG